MNAGLKQAEELGTGVSTIRVSEWDKDVPLLSEGASLTHPLTRMVLTSVVALGRANSIFAAAASQ